jgi:hypothetical protein
MATYVPALFWAAVIILVAVLSKAGFIERNVAEFLVLTLPVAGWLAISRGRHPSCRPVGG